MFGIPFVSTSKLILASDRGSLPSLKECSSSKKQFLLTLFETVKKVNIATEHRLSESDANPGLLEKGVFSSGVLTKHVQSLKEQHSTLLKNSKTDEAQSNKALREHKQNLLRKITTLIKNIETQIEMHCEKGHFTYGMAPPSYFTPITEDEPDVSSPQRKPFMFSLKEGVLPSNALDAISCSTPEAKTTSPFEAPVELSFLNSENICEYSILRCLETTFGKEKFNELFSSKSITPLALGMGYSLNPLHLLTTKVTIQTKDDIGDGQWIHLESQKNDDQYAFCYLSINGWRKCVGFGLKPSWPVRISLEPLNTGLEKKMVTKELTAPPKINSFSGFNLNLHELLTTGDLTLSRSTICLNFNRIDRLVGASIEEGKELMQQWHLEHVNTLKKQFIE